MDLKYIKLNNGAKEIQQATLFLLPQTSTKAILLLIYTNYFPEYLTHSLNIFNTLFDLPCEKLHIRFLKYVLGVHRKATNAAVLMNYVEFI